MQHDKIRVLRRLATAWKLNWQRARHETGRLFRRLWETAVKHRKQKAVSTCAQVRRALVKVLVTKLQSLQIGLRQGL